MTHPAPVRSYPLAAPGSVAPMTLAERAALAENDADNATRLLSVFGRDLVYIINRGWAVWDGVRYVLTGGELAAFGIAARLRGMVEMEADHLRLPPPPAACRAAVECRCRCGRNHVPRRLPVAGFRWDRPLVCRNRAKVAP